MKEDLIKDIEKPSQKVHWFRKYVINQKYIITIVAFLVWMTFFDNNSFLVIHELNNDIEKYEQKLQYYKAEYQKTSAFYHQLMSNKEEREKYARENYFMKKENEEIFILVTDSAAAKK